MTLTRDGSAGSRAEGTVMTVVFELDGEKSQRVMAAMLKMRKIEIAELERAAAG